MFKKWYRVFLANNEVVRLSRGMSDQWIFDTSRMMSFHDENGKRVTISKHWIIKVVEE